MMRCVGCEQVTGALSRRRSPAALRGRGFMLLTRRDTALAGIGGHWRALAHELHVASVDGAHASIDRESDMNRDQMKGMAQQVKGKINEVVGKATRNRTQQLKGELQQAAGTARKAFGDGKQKIGKLGR